MLYDLNVTHQTQFGYRRSHPVLDDPFGVTHDTSSIWIKAAKLSEMLPRQ